MKILSIVGFGVAHRLLCDVKSKLEFFNFDFLGFEIGLGFLWLFGLVKTPPGGTPQSYATYVLDDTLRCHVGCGFGAVEKWRNFVIANN